MSIEAVHAALYTVVANPTAKLVLIGLANHASPDLDDARPAVETLAAYACCSKRSAQRHLRSLEQSELIEKTGEYLVEGRRDRAVNVYRLRGDKLTPRSAAGRHHGSLRGDRALSPEPSLGTVPSTANAVDVSKSAQARENDQPSLDRSFEERVERFLEVHATKVEARGVARPARTAASREAARRILRREADSRAIVARLDWALAHRFWSTRVRTIPKFDRAWDDLTLQWRAEAESTPRNGTRDADDRPPVSGVSYEGDRVVITR